MECDVGYTILESWIQVSWLAMQAIPLYRISAITLTTSECEKLSVFAIDECTGCLNAGGLKNHMEACPTAGNRCKGNPGGMEIT